MTWESQVRTAVKSQDWGTLSRAVKDLVDVLRTDPRPVDAVALRRVLGYLRGARRYEDLLALADAALVRGSEDPAVTRAYAQGLLDRGAPVAALRLLESLPATGPGVSPVDRAERAGSLGRAHKELYLLDPTPGRAAHLNAAVAAYRSAYLEDAARVWHGVNLVALLARAAADEQDVSGSHAGSVLSPGAAKDESGRLARVLLEVARAELEPDAWTLAVAAEASVAVGDFDQADVWIDRFVDASDADAFKLASALRQLEQVWRLDLGSDPGRRLLPRLRSALLSHVGGQISVSPADLKLGQMAGLEKVFGPERYNSLTWYRTGLERCRAVARIEDAFGDGVGTGFMVDGRGLHTDLPPLVVVTNAHVVPDELPAQSAYVTFRGLENDPGAASAVTRRYRVKAVPWSSSATAPGLDASLLVLDSWPAQVTPAPVASALPPRDREPHARAYVIGHPKGVVQPQFSLQDNEVLDYDERVVHYRSPTEPGSSGSPVFDDSWAWIALHHSGRADMPRLGGRGGTYEANEGISVLALRSALMAAPPERLDRTDATSP